MEEKPKNILIGIDASDQSFEAVRYVGKLFPPGKAKVTLLHVMNVIPDSLWDLESSPELRYRVTGFNVWEIEQRKMVDDFMQKAKRLLLSMGHPEDNIREISREKQVGVARDIAVEARRGYDAVVVGRRGISELKDLILGSTANKLLSRLHDVPVWIVGGQPDTGKILIAMDSSQGAARAMNYVENIFQGRFPQLLLLHVSRGLGFLDPAFDQLLVTELEREWFEETQKALRIVEDDMEFRLQECVRRLESRAIDPNRIEAKVIQGVASRSGAILKEAHKENIGTIVVGRRGLSKIEEFIMGSVSSKVLQLAKDTTVWVVH